MPRRTRGDRPGRLHHVLNRGLSRRPMFESERDQRVFLALLACAARSGRIELHAFSLMTTHFHLLVRSLDGNLAGTMRWLQSQYARYFNRSRGRDGPLVRGRFRSFPITTVAYLITVIRYIDANPVQAGVTRDALEYPGGSARWHAAPRAPKWLDRRLVDAYLAPHRHAGLDRTEAYQRVFSTDDGDPSLKVARVRLEQCRGHTDALDEARLWNSERRRAWIRARALRADGVPPGTPLVDVGSLRAITNLHRRRAPSARACTMTGGTGRDIWRLIEAGLLRDLCGTTFAQAGAAMGVTTSHASRLYKIHREAVGYDPDYVTFAAEIARQSIARCYDSLSQALIDTTVDIRLLGMNT